MKNKKVIYLVLVVALLAAGFVYSKKVFAPNPVSNVTTLYFYHMFDAGLHTIAGEINTGSSCEFLTQVDVAHENVEFLESEVSVNVSTSGSSSVTPSECATDGEYSKKFRISFEAPENSRINITINGISVPANLIKIDKNYDLENFEDFTNRG